MSVRISNWIFSHTFKAYCPLITNIDYFSTSTNLSAKKINVKNKFAFQDEYRKHFDKCNSEYRHISEEMGYVSADLLPNEKKFDQEKDKLLERKKSRKPSLTYKGEILFGIHPVYLALLQKRRIFHHLYTREEDSSSEGNVLRKSEIIKLAQSMDIPVSFVDSRGLRILAPGAVHQGICLDAGFFPLPSWEEDKYEFDASESRPLWLILDEILDPMNVGAIIRSANYFGVEKIFTIKENSCKLSPTVSKASSGSLEVMDVYQLDNLEDFIKKRKSSGWSIVSTLAYSENKSGFPAEPVNAAQFNTSKPTILILGNEGRGISENVLKLCDILVSIEPGRTLPEGIDSLNVSVATGVLLYILNNSKEC